MLIGPAQELRARFRARFGAEARVFRAPGRINLIGEHTDYNDGFVMPAAIGFYCWIAVAPRDDRRLVVHSEDFSETFEADLAGGPPPPSRKWSDYPVGVAVTLERAGLGVRGANLLIRGEVPIGAGLSSSAAVEVATAQALLGLLGRDVDRARLARLCQQAENEYVGARCGIMDQFVSLHARDGRALMLDCRSLDYELLPIPEAAQLVVCNTMVKHELASNGYNQRRAECEEAVARLSRELPGVSALRDVSPEQLARHRAALPETVYRRALHVVSENARVSEAAAALRSGDLTRFGRLMAESHASLRDLYEVSCAELDLMVELARGRDGVHGARMTGGGFGGSTVNLVDARRAEDVRQDLAAAYEKATGIVPQIHVCAPSEGAGPVLE
jgi:galactokinase